MIKRSTKIILTLALLFILGGGLSTFFLYNNLKEQREKNEIRETFAYDGSETLNLKFNRNTKVSITESKDDQVHMEKTGLPLDQRAAGLLKWKIDKKDKETTVSINNEKSKRTLPFNFTFLENNVSNDRVTLSLPSGFKNIIINGRQLELSLYDFSPEKLKINSEHGNIRMQNINTKEIRVDSTYNNLYLEKVKATQDIKLKTHYGSITVIDAHAKTFDLRSTGGDIFTGNTHGDLISKTTNGATSINHTYGKALIESKNSDIDFHSIFTNDDIELKTIHGNLDIQLDEKGWKKAAISVKTDNGTITDLMDETLKNGENSFEKTQGTPQFKAETKNGYIAAFALEEDDTHYGDDGY